MNFSNNSKRYLEVKKGILESQGYIVGEIQPKYSGYNKDYTGWKFRVNGSKRAYKYKIMSNMGAIDLLTKKDLILWYLDDGSYHINRKTMHLYSNMFNKEESLKLIDKITDLFNIDPRLRIDRKKDGREFYYLYFRRRMVKVFRPMVEDFLRENSINDLLYKAGIR